MSGVGGRSRRPDAAAKATGRQLYVGDMTVPGMLHAAIKPSAQAPARIRRIDVAPAREIDGVVDVITAADLADRNHIGIIFADQPLLAADEIRMVGERLAVVAAETPAACRAALEAITVDVEPLPGLYDIEHALDEGVHQVHPSGNLIKTFAVQRGELDAAREAAEIVIDETYRIGGQEHAYLETQGCLAVPEPTGGLTLYASCQCPFYVRGSVARLLELPISAVRVVQTPTGGGFGGKEDYPSEVAACAALLATRTRRPVRLILPRELDVQASTKRHRMVVHHRLYADTSGRILGVDIDILVDAGAYVGLSTVVAERANSSAVGPYAVNAIRVETKVLYTNNLFGGPFRGFGAPQVTVAHECQMDRLAREVDLGPLEIRRRNALTSGRAVWTTGETIAEPERFGRVLDALAETEAAKGPQCTVEENGRFRHGTGIAVFIYGCNLHHGGQPLDRSGALLQVQVDGSVTLAIGVTDMGQGALTAARAMAASALGADEERIHIQEVDTAVVPDSGPTVASRATLVAGQAICDAANQLLERLLPLAAGLLGVDVATVRVVPGGFAGEGNGLLPFAKVAAKLYAERINPAACGWYRSEPRAYDPATGQGQAYMFYSFGGHATRVRVDTWTGKVEVLDVAAVHDVGRIIHAAAIEGQVEGGVVQALGWALMEELKLDQGRLVNPNLTDYLIPTAVDAPRVTMTLLEEPEPDGPFGARGIGEPSFIPGGAAIANAVACAVGRPVTELPLTPERVLGLIV
ncbi:MAG: xanthine dehydrogenase family protein molybdopterin-binding subunit [bacterium]